MGCFLLTFLLTISYNSISIILVKYSPTSFKESNNANQTKPFSEMVTQQNGSILTGLDSHQSFDVYGNGANGYQYTQDHVFYERSSSRAPNSDKNTREQPQGTDRVKNIATEYGITVSSPKYQQYAIKDVRLGSFGNWPSNRRQRPESLAEAGFFYSGKSDIVFCFYCGQGLQDWKDDDIAWCEHAKWSPDCPFLLNIKGREFVRLEQLKESDPDQYKEEKSKENKPKVRGSDRDTWNNPAVESLLQNGYSKEMVQKAILLFHKRNGDYSTLSAPELLSLIFDLEDGVVECEVEEKEETGHQEDVAERENAQLWKSVYCRKCKTNLVSVVFLPCGHLCTCTDCGPSVKYCLICNQFIKGTVRSYLV